MYILGSHFPYQNYFTEWRSSDALTWSLTGVEHSLSADQCQALGLVSTCFVTGSYLKDTTGQIVEPRVYVAVVGNSLGATDGSWHLYYWADAGAVLPASWGTDATSCPPPNIIAPGQVSFQGWVDSQSCTSIGGWAWDWYQPNTTISVDVYVDGSKLTTISANQYRADLAHPSDPLYYYGNGNHGFTWTIPTSLKDGVAHAVSIRYPNKPTDLGGSPTSFTCTAPATVTNLVISPTSVTANGSATGTVTISPSQTADIFINLSSNHPSSVVVPSSVRVLANHTTATFPITTTTAQCEPLTATVTANYNGTKTATLTVNPQASLFGGYHDSIDTNSLTSGWAWDQNNPYCRSRVDVYLDTVLKATVTANLFRSDLNGYGDGYHGWNYPFSSPIDGLAHQITAKHHVTGVAENYSPRGFAYNVPIFPTLTPPTTDNAGSGEVGSRFHATYAGVIKSLRFYQAALETGSHMLNLWSDTGTRLGCTVIQASAGAGWKEGILYAPGTNPATCTTTQIKYSITANTNYRVSYNVNAHYYKDPCSPAYPFTNSVAKGNYGFSIVATAGYYSGTPGSFPNISACSNLFADVKFYAGTQTGSIYGPVGGGPNDPPPDARK